MKSFVLLIFALFSISTLSAQDNLKVIYEDNFDGQHSNRFKLGTENSQKVSIINGALRVENISNTKLIGWALKDVGLKMGDNFIIEFDINYVSGEKNNTYGLAINKKDNPLEFMELCLSGTQYRKLTHYKNSKYSNIRDWKKKEKVIKEQGNWNHVKVVRTRNVLSYYVNDVLMLTYGKYEDVGTIIGFVVDSKGMIIDVDNLKVSTFDHEINNVIGHDKQIKKEYLPINTEFNERFCYISADGKTLFVSKKDKKDEKADTDVWTSTTDGKNWTPLEKMPFPVNNTGNNSVISASSDKNTIYLMNTYKSDGTPDKSGISVSNKTKDGWEVPKTIQVDSLVNKNKYVSYFFTADNKILLLGVQPNEEDYDEQALFVSFKREDGTYTPPKNLGPTINTAAMDFNPFLAPDSKTLYFSSTGHPGYGSADIWVSRRLDDTWQNWSEPENLGPYINTPEFELNLTLDAEGNYAYLTSYDKELAGYKGDGDVMKLELPEGAKPQPVVLIYGKVLNKNTNEPISANINYFDLSTETEYGTAISDVNNGEYNIVLPSGKNFGFKSEAKGYVSISENLDLTNLGEYKKIEKNLYLVPIEVGQTIRLNNLFFDTGEFELKEESNSELNTLLKLLNQNPNMQIKIVGHTDNVGSDANNLTLSKNRANSVYEWLIDKNVDKSKLQAVGMGEKEPVETNDTEEGRQQNRRVEFTILKK